MYAFLHAHGGRVSLHAISPTTAVPATDYSHAMGFPFYCPGLGFIVPKPTLLIYPDNEQPPGSDAAKAPPVAYTDIKKDRNGKNIFVRHKGKSISAIGGKEPSQDVKKAAEAEAKAEQNGSKDEKKNEEPAAATGGSAFTPEEDAKLKEMKAAGASWKNIIEEMKRSKKELQARWREIENKPKATGTQEKPDESNNVDEKAKKDEDAKADGHFTTEDDAKIKELLASKTGYKKIAQELGRKMDSAFKDHLNKLKAEIAAAPAAPDEKKEENKTSNEEAKPDTKPMNDTKKNKKAKRQETKEAKKQEEAPKKHSSPRIETPKPASVKAPSVAASRLSRRSEVRFTMSEWRALQEDELFSFDELQLLSEIIMKGPSQSWLAVASRFHDKTGRRVHPEDVREKFEQMARMGK